MDVPATLTGQRLSKGIFRGGIWSVAAAFLLTAVIVTAEMTSDVSHLQPWLLPVTETAAWAIALAPLCSPLYEIWAFSRLPAERIEEAVRITVPLQVLLLSACAYHRRGGRRGPVLPAWRGCRGCAGRLAVW